jgi:hypothetical protein
MRSSFRILTRNPLLRISIHPVDLRHRAVWQQIRRLITRALEDRQPLTYDAWLAQPPLHPPPAPAL